VVNLVLLLVAGCGSSESNDTTAGPIGQKPTCELATRTELVDENEVAPNGQTGAKIRAAVLPR
jgi:hypothetical protein